MGDMFQSTHPHGVRPSRLLHIVYTSCFNPRTRMGCDVYAEIAVLKEAGFNPRTRMGCDASLIRLSCHISVSIHAPAWGATNPQSRCSSHSAVSIHAPAWGATS